MAAYCRVSTEKEEQLSSLENQREFFEQYADKEGDTLVKIYADAMHRQLKILGTVSGALGLFRILTRHLNWA